jgi:hypothetical protein
MATNYTTIRNGLLTLLGQASAVAAIDPLCLDSVEMLGAAKETGVTMKDEILALLKMMPKEQDNG